MFDSYLDNTLQYHPDRCINCRRCTQVCPHGVFAEGKEHAELMQPSSCMECGARALNYSVQAIESAERCWLCMGNDERSTQR